LRAIVFRLGVQGERYPGIGKRVWQLEARPVLADEQGPFGSPVSDSTRSMIGPSARQILVILYAPAVEVDAILETAMARTAERLVQFAGAEKIRSLICKQ
jgi:DNA/RNA-binding domain of Phe-tRNA-synthetase-like protein